MCLSIHISPWLLIRSLIHRLKSNSLLRNSIFIMGSTVITSAIGYIYWVVAARIYPAHDIGQASAFISAMTLTSIFANLGIGSALVQILPRRENGHAWSLTLNICIAIGILTSLLGGIIVARALPYFSPQFAVASYHAIYTLIFIVGVALSTIATLLDQTFIAERASSNMAVRNAMFALFKLPLMVLLVQIGSLGIFSSWILALGATVILAGLVLVPRLKRGYCLAVRGMRSEIRPMFSSFVGHHFINIGGILPLYLLPVFVAVRLSVTDNAYFYTTWMTGSIFFMVSPSVATALFSEGSHEASDILRKAQDSIVIISKLLGPILLVFLLGGRYILSLFGPNYPQHGVMLLMLLILSAVPDAITNIYVSLLRVQRRLHLAALLNLGMATFTLALAWILLPKLGIAGAGWAWLIAQLLGSIGVGADIFTSRNKKAGDLTIVAVTHNFSPEKETYSLSVEQSYLNAETISLMDTAILPIVSTLSREYAKRKEVNTLLDTAILPTMKKPPISPTFGEENRTREPCTSKQILRKVNIIAAGAEDEVR